MIAMMLSAFGSGMLEAAPKRAVKRTAPAKPSNASVLVNQLVFNTYRPNVNLGEACKLASFKNLAIAMNMNRSLLTHEKGEFMTSESYGDLVSKVAAVMEAKPIIFCESLNDNEDVSFKYDADSAMFEGSTMPSHNVWRDVKQLGTYRSRTRMGVAATVKASVEFEYNIDMSLPEVVAPCLDGRYIHTFHVPATIADAPAIKRSGRVVFIAKLERPYISEDRTSGEPTIDDPYDVTTQTLKVYAKLQKMIVIGPAGNEVWSCNVDPSVTF
jgi:hypothetical protein